ncbi:hypothetical protein A7985_11435 [Pseudoalteromonas luteoviolacea]|uniref:DUF676 domain-containing protein n=1 Tax=Pseudoalteromonas luteoviolacea TaxID=43657 RepID=A0A1C0TQK5_9GAMM|nr:hypothetical protein [Pseudoalteromonas luteoviolacea]MBQ4811476.1 hypothetical protein [Pseudoalteromonas luteoviolacea]OCQ21234.1 hypothetical protein A7985_11435 [Pseudoalteromonas luteoviolacea]
MISIKKISILALAFYSQFNLASTVEGYPSSELEYVEHYMWYNNVGYPMREGQYIKLDSGQQYNVQNDQQLDLSYSSYPECRQAACFPIASLNARIIKSRDGVLDKPVYFIKGLNVTADGISTGHHEFNKYWYDYRLRDVFIPLLNAGRDIVFIEYVNTSDKLVPHTAQLVHFIETKMKRGNHQSSMVGYSYGGILAKKALNFIESSRYNHEVFNYISIDTPHKGANIPYTITETIGRIKGRLEDARGCSWSSSCDRARKNARRMYASLTEGVAAQLLVTGKESYQYFRKLADEGYPSTYNVAFSNGSYTGTSAGLPTNTQMARFEVDYSVYGDTYYTLKSLNISSKYKMGHYYRSHNFDNAPGSYTITGQMLQEFFDGNGNIRRVTNNLLSNNRKPTFITTASALDLNTNDMTSSFNPNSVSTPFDKVYGVNGRNLSHTDFSYHKNNLILEIKKAN